MYPGENIAFSLPKIHLSGEEFHCAKQQNCWPQSGSHECRKSFQYSGFKTEVV